MAAIVEEAWKVQALSKQNTASRLIHGIPRKRVLSPSKTSLPSNFADHRIIHRSQQANRIRSAEAHTTTLQTVSKNSRFVGVERYVHRLRFQRSPRVSTFTRCNTSATSDSQFSSRPLSAANIKPISV